MLRFRYWVLTVVALGLALTFLRFTWSESPKQTWTTSSPAISPSGAKGFDASSDKQGRVCKVYALESLGNDPNLGQWLADTLPQMLPSSESSEGGYGTSKQYVSYNAAGKFLMVCGTPVAHARVTAFLDEVRAALVKQQEKPTTGFTTMLPEPCAIPVAYANACATVGNPTPVTTWVSRPAGSPGAYPVPPPSQKTKHLFHFIIRYEGEGIVDDSVASVIKDVYRKKAEKEEAENKSAVPSVTYAPTLPPTMPVAGPLTLPSPAALAPGTTQAIPADGFAPSSGAVLVGSAVKPLLEVAPMPAVKKEASSSSVDRNAP